MKIAIIGGGIVGCFLAYDLSAYDADIMVFEQNTSVCDEVSSANSAIIHAGYDPEDGTLKASLNKLGARAYPAICEKLHVSYHACGGMVLATCHEEEQTLMTLQQRAQKRGIRTIILTRDELLKEEPHISDNVTMGLSVPDTAVVTPWEVGHALMQEAVHQGVDLHTSEGVTKILKQANGYDITTVSTSYHVDVIINAAGLGSEKIMRMIEEKPLFTMIPKRGQYYVLSKYAKSYATHVCYPAPSVLGKGVLVVPTVHGNQLVGPNNETIQEQDTSTTAKGLSEVKQSIAKTMKNVPLQEVIHSYSGIRPSGNHGDFFIQASPNDEHVIHLGCIDSPGLASAPAIAQYVIQQLMLPVMELKEKEMLPDAIRTSDYSQLNQEMQAEKRKENPAYGHMICRCEHISEQEIVDCIHEICGARTIKEIKKRLRPGMGKCQGGYCEIEVAKLLARELHIPLSMVRYDKTTYFKESKVSQHETH